MNDMLHPLFRDILNGFAQCRATGNHRVAQNDEPEPTDERLTRERRNVARDLAYARARDNGSLEQARFRRAAELETRQQDVEDRVNRSGT